MVRKSAENSRHKGNKNSSLISLTSEERELSKKSVVDVTVVENEVLKAIVQVLLEEKNLFRAN